MGAFRYTIRTLFNIGQRSRTTCEMSVRSPLDPSLWQRLNELGICASRTTRLKQRKIDVQITARQKFVPYAIQREQDMRYRCLHVINPGVAQLTTGTDINLTQEEPTKATCL